MKTGTTDTSIVMRQIALTANSIIQEHRQELCYCLKDSETCGWHVLQPATWYDRTPARQSQDAAAYGLAVTRIANRGGDVGSLSSAELRAGATKFLARNSRTALQQVS